MTKWRKKFRAILAAIVVMTTLAGCNATKVSDLQHRGSLQPGARPCGTFNLAINSWVGYEANAAVVAYLAIVPMFAGYLLFGRGLAELPASTATTPAETTAPASGEQAATPAPAEEGHQPPVNAQPPSGPAPVEGTDYLVIDGGQPIQPATGKIEVAEVFGYVCPACAAFQPLVGPWKAGLPSDVNFVYVPAMFGGTWDDYARAFYAAEQVGDRKSVV